MSTTDCNKLSDLVRSWASCEVLVARSTAYSMKSPASAPSDESPSEASSSFMAFFVRAKSSGYLGFSMRQGQKRMKSHCSEIPRRRSHCRPRGRSNGKGNCDDSFLPKRPGLPPTSTSPARMNLIGIKIEYFYIFGDRNGWVEGGEGDCRDPYKGAVVKNSADSVHGF